MSIFRIVMCVTFFFAPLAGTTRAGVTLYETFKSKFFNQFDDSSPPVPTIFNFVPRLTVDNAADVASVSVQAPNNVIGLSSTDGLTYSATRGPFLSKADLDAAYPNSVYTFMIAGGTLGTQSGDLDIATDHFPVTVPQFTGGTFSRLQNLNVFQDNLLTWNTYSQVAGANTPLTFFTIFDPGDNVAFTTNGSNQLGQVTLPAGTLLPNTTYTVDLAFSNRQVDSVSGFGGSFTSVAFDYRTDFSFTTSVPEPSAAALAALGALGLLGPLTKADSLWRRKNVSRTQVGVQSFRRRHR